MLLPKFNYHEPRSLDEATRLMGELGRDSAVLAGGTDLLVKMKRGKILPKNVVYLARIEEVKKVKQDPGSFTIGACVTVADLKENGDLKPFYGGLSEAAGSLGSPLIRNLATIGGNIATASPAADLPPSLIAYGANLLLKKEGGQRTVPLERFFVGPGQTILEPGEILTGIVLSKPPRFSGCGYVKLGVRKSLEISIVNVAAFLALEGTGQIREACIVLGAVAPTPVRAPSAERALIGRGADEAVFQRAAEEAARDAKPIDDFRASAEYRREMVKALTRKALRTAYERAKLNESRSEK